MNTPPPCHKCKHCYFDALSKDDPNDCAECKLELTIGNLECESFEHWEGKTCLSCAYYGRVSQNCFAKRGYILKRDPSDSCFKYVENISLLSESTK